LGFLLGDIVFNSDFQNQDQSVSYLKIQRDLYDKLKTYIGVQYFVIFGLSLVALYLSVEKNMKIGPISFFVLLVDIFLVQRIIKKNQHMAASVQELFDTKLFELPWNNFLGAEKIYDDEIDRLDRNSKIDVYKHKLIDWYPKKAFSLAADKGRLVCQQANLGWNLSGRKVVLKALYVTITILILAASIYFYVNEIEFDEIITRYLMPLAPGVYRLKDIVVKMRSSKNRLESLKKTNLSLIETAPSLSSEELDQLSRSLQDQIFLNRKTDLPIFNSLYWKMRSNEEEVMNNMADKLYEKLA
jgi:hypothetical protein